MKSWNKISVRGNVLYKNTTKGFNNSNFGKLSSHNIIFDYLIIGNNELCNLDSIIGNPGIKWSVFTGYSGELLGKIRVEKELDPNSGYYIGLGTIGTIVAYNSWSLPLSFSIPLVQVVNGDQGSNSYRLKVGLMKTF